MSIFGNNDGFGNGTFTSSDGQGSFGYHPMRTMDQTPPLAALGLGRPAGAQPGPGMGSGLLGPGFSTQPGLMDQQGPPIGGLDAETFRSMNPLHQLMAVNTGLLAPAANGPTGSGDAVQTGQPPMQGNAGQPTPGGSGQEGAGQGPNGGGQPGVQPGQGVGANSVPGGLDSTGNPIASGGISDGAPGWGTEEQRGDGRPRGKDVLGDPITEPGLDDFRDDGTLYGYLIASGGTLTHYGGDGKVRGTYSYTSGDGNPDETVKNHGPIPKGVYYLYPHEISEYYWFRDWDKDAWGEYRVPLHPADGTVMHGRNNFFIHGGKFPGSAGCIDIGNQDVILFPILRQVPGKMRLTVK